jgi:ketosteroid isomerase-like protein
VPTEENKAVIRRFIAEVLEGGDLDVLDELLATEYVNPAMGVTDRAGFRALLDQMRGAITMHIEDMELVAEGDVVVTRYSLRVTPPDGQELSARGLTFYRLANGRITVDEPFTSPDLAQLMGLAPPAA